MPASSSAGIFRYLKETTPGEIETGGPQIYRVTDGTLSQTTESSEDNELRADRGRGDTTLVSGSVNGPLSINWSHKTHDDFLQSLLASTYTEVGTDGVKTVSDMAFDGSAHTITSGTAALPSLEKGQWFQISGANTAANDGIYKVSDSVAPTTSTITLDTAVKDATTDAANSTTISSARLKQSNSALESYTIEREMADVSQFLTWKGVYVASLNLNYSVGDKLNGAFNFIGTETEEGPNTSSQFPGIGSEVAATTSGYFNTVTNTHVLLDGTAMGESCVESLTIDVQGNLRERRCLGGGLAASSLGADQFKISTQANIFFGTTASANLYKKKLADSALTFAVCLQDADGNGVAVTLPRGKISSAEITGGALGSDVMLNLSFDAVTSPDFSTMIIFDRLGSVA